MHFIVWLSELCHLEHSIIHIKVSPGPFVTRRLGCSVQQCIWERKNEGVRKKPPVSGPNVSGSRRHGSLVHLDPDRFRSQLGLLDRRLRSSVGLQVFNSSTNVRIQRVCLVHKFPVRQRILLLSFTGSSVDVTDRGVWVGVALQHVVHL